MRVALVAVNAKYIHSNLAIRYLKSYYDHNFKSHDISLHEFTINQNSEQMLAHLYKQKADLIGFSCYIWNIDIILNLIKDLKAVAPKTRIFLGGPEVTYKTREIMEANPAIDYIISGEGEEVLAYFLESKFFERDLLEKDWLAAISYRENGEVITNSQVAKVCDLGKIPSVYGRMTVEEVQEVFANKIIYYESSRGCPFSCQYCLSSLEQGVRFFPMAQVKRDLKLFLDAGVKQVKFVDRTFNCKDSFAREIYDWIIEHNRGLTNFHFEITADLLSEEMLDYLGTVPPGLFQFEIGVQSTHGPTLDAVQRRTQMDRLEANVRRIKEAGNIHQHLDLIVGLPHEDYATFAKSFDQVYNMEPDKLQMGFLKVLRGSGMEDGAEAYGFIYSQQAPYEILSTKDLTYGEIIRLKEIEDVLEHYYNSHQYSLTISYLLEVLDLSPFTFYEALADYSREAGFFDQSHSQLACYQNFHDFLLAQYQGQDQILAFARELLKFDFYRLSPHGSLPAFFLDYDKNTRKGMLDDFKARRHSFLTDETMVEKYFSDYRDLNLRELSKRIRIEILEIDIESFAEGKNIYLLVYHDDPLNFRRASYYNISEEF